MTSERNVVLGTQVSAAVLQDSEDHVVEIDLPDDQTPDMDQQSSSPKQDAEHVVQSTTSIASEASTASHDATVQYAIVGDHSVEIHLPASEVEQVMATQSDNAHTSTETTQTDQPSMIADRSDEGQPLTQGTTFRGGKKDPVKFYNSKDEIFPANAKYGIVLTSDESKVDIEETKKLYQPFGDFVESEVSKLGKYEILEIDGKKFLFEGKNK